MKCQRWVSRCSEIYNAQTILERLEGGGEAVAGGMVERNGCPKSGGCPARFSESAAGWDQLIAQRGPGFVHDRTLTLTRLHGTAFNPDRNWMDPDCCRYLGFLGGLISLTMPCHITVFAAPLQSHHQPKLHNISHCDNRHIQRRHGTHSGLQEIFGVSHACCYRQHRYHSQPP